MIKNILLPFYLFLIAHSIFAQNLDRYIEQQQVVPFQKLYLHTDRDFYFYGDTLWFASYLVNGQTHILSDENCNLYVELINSNGKITQKYFFQIKNGTCPGYFSFAGKDFKEGTYLMRAYTDYLKNFGDDSFFEKTIKVSETKNSVEVSEEQNLSTDSTKIDIQFFPEGGFLLADQINLVTFKAINQLGKDIDVNGKITDGNGKFICSFRSVYKGMGKFYLTPKKNKTYKIQLEKYPEFNPELPEIRIKGSKIIVAKENEEYVKLNILSANRNLKDSFFIACMHRGEGTFFMKIHDSQIHKTIEIKTNSFKVGINRIVLLNSDFEPLSERMIFLNPENEVNLKVEPNQVQLTTREKATINIETNLLSENEIAQLSVAVVNESALNVEGNSQNIKSYLLIDSELKGQISSPADFFIDDEDFAAKDKLELLMLTNGWKNYIWNHLKKEEVNIQFEPLLGMTFKGLVLNDFRKKIMKKSKVILGIKSKNESEFLAVTPDANGNFEFKNILVYDTATIFAQGKDRKNKPRTYLEFYSSEFGFPINIEKVKQLKSYSAIPLSFYRLNYFNNRVLKEFDPDYDTRLLEEINITAEKPKVPDGHNRIYGEPSASEEITDIYYGYANVFEYIRGRFAGVTVKQADLPFPKYSVEMRGTNSINLSNEAMYIVDGIQVFGTNNILNIPMSQIDKIEVLKGPDAAIYGVRGANGVVSILTKGVESRSFSSITVPGTIVKNIKGFVHYREFYSPKYNSESIKSETPDVRTTLYWNPNVNIKNGKAEISFFTCDNVSRYKIFVEGISATGKICLGSGEFDVNSRK